ncbi:class I SAM-dependent methyltransferase [Dermatobacter hominis]|uniref:class I SAM-dependent methyltransferase n=1 Tax=Dermatobacter hominis TaxID=2884263 RepID=UPI001D0FE4EA|nr:class I SAM-dependent methyltransferase [Dermatobacter hominis]UDY35100.1 class I SAM-dependent methyltransferase [Dermatobacter hominis]
MVLPDPRQYDAFARAYEEHAADAPYNAHYDRPSTLRLLGEVAGRRVFDAACGPGHYLASLLEMGAHVRACDASPAMVELAQARAGDDVDVRVASLDDPLDWLADGSFDVVLCALAYHYLNDRRAFLAEARRILRPGGALVISTHHPASDWVRLGGSYFAEEPLTETWTKGWEITAWRLPLTTLTEEFADEGYVIERLVEPRPEPSMAAVAPDTFEWLNMAPGFIQFRLRVDRPA